MKSGFARGLLAAARRARREAAWWEAYSDERPERALTCAARVEVLLLMAKECERAARKHDKTLAEAREENP